MRLFIYSWQVLDLGSPFRVHAYGLDVDNKQTTIIIRGHEPYCYFDDTLNVDAAIRASSVRPTSVRRVLRTPTVDISAKRYFSKVSFRTYGGMKNFVRSTFCKNYMSDVDPILGFLSSYGFAFTGWYEIPVHDVVVDVSSITYLGDITTQTYPKIACIDIETLSSLGYGMPKPYKRGDTIQMVSIVLKRYLDKKVTKYLVYVGDEIKGNGSTKYISTTDEIQLITKLAEIIRLESPDIITGYNIFGFDLGYIISRLKLRLLPLPNMSNVSGGTTTTTRVNWSSSAYGINIYDRVEISGKVFVDLMLFFKRMKLDKYSLDFVSKTFLGSGKKDMSPDEMWMYFRNRDPSGLRKVAKYCIHDSVLTLDLFDKFFLWTDICEMSSAMKCSLEDIYTRGEQLKVLNQVVYKCVERNLVLVLGSKVKSVQYEGAHVLDPIRGVFEGCTVVDFQSLYPSILIAYNICPSTFIDNRRFLGSDSINVVDTGRSRHTFRKHPIGVLPDLVQNLLSQRKQVKEQLAVTQDELTRVVLDRRQNALKICANSVYGIMGSGNKYMGHTPTAESVACMGRQLLDSAVMQINKDFPVTVVYGDTDSCFIYHNGSTDANANKIMAQTIVDAVNAQLPNPLKLLVEKYYPKMAFLTKKRYLMYDGQKVTSKGTASARRNYCTFARRLYLETVSLIFEKSPDKVLKYVVKAVDKLLSGKIPLVDLVMTKSIKNLESYTNTNTPHVFMANRLIGDGNNIELGSRLEYIFVKVSGAKLQGEKMFTPDEVTKLGLDVDFLYYVDKQLMTPLDELLALIGYEDCIKNIYLAYS